MDQAGEVMHQCKITRAQGGKSATTEDKTTAAGSKGMRDALKCKGVIARLTLGKEAPPEIGTTFPRRQQPEHVLDPGYPDASAVLEAIAHGHDNFQDLDAEPNDAASLWEEANINDGEMRSLESNAALRQVQIARMEHFERFWGAADRERTLISFMNIVVAIWTGQAVNPGVFQSPLLPGWRQHPIFQRHSNIEEQFFFPAISLSIWMDPAMELITDWAFSALRLIFKADNVQKIEWIASILEQMSKSLGLVYNLLKAGQGNLARCQDITWSILPSTPNASLRHLHSAKPPAFTRSIANCKQPVAPLQNAKCLVQRKALFKKLLEEERKEEAKRQKAIQKVTKDLASSLSL
ncbi:hypothetical protein CBOM_06545 [Ceraceosorus bombacis]|uniref:Uncharacterized protein n=1 Tax=Ceraceosorus bombacis TaxID=401625 RepID=A0A0P1BL05_9BASI|nr:hypothetical protein CBOM_06545 [Ceraceosorus bombacis]